MCGLGGRGYILGFGGGVSNLAFRFCGLKLGMRAWGWDLSPRSSLNPKPLGNPNPKPLNPKPLNPKPLWNTFFLCGVWARRYCFLLYPSPVPIPWAPLSNSWIIIIMWLYIALNRTPNIDCYWGAVPNLNRAVSAARGWGGGVEGLGFGAVGGLGTGWVEGR